jgi:hypothetical protein
MDPKARCRVAPPPVLLPTPKEVPGWVKEATAHLEEVALAERWKVCIVAWLKFEEVVGYGTASRTSQVCSHGSDSPFH